MPLTYTEIEKINQSKWEKLKKEALVNNNKKIPVEYLLKIFEVINLDNDTKVNEETDQQSQETKTIEEKITNKENKQEPTTWTQFKTKYPNITQVIKSTKNTWIKVLTALITLFENNDEFGITEYIVKLNQERKKEKMNNEKIEEKIKNFWEEIKRLEQELSVNEPLSLLSCSSESKEEKTNKKIECLLIKIISFKVSQLQMEQFSSEVRQIINQSEQSLKEYDDELNHSSTL